MAKLVLDMPLIDLGGGSESGAQRMASELLRAFNLRKIAAHPGGKRRLLDETRHLLVVEPIRPNGLALSGHAAE